MENKTHGEVNNININENINGMKYNILQSINDNQSRDDANCGH